MLGILVASASVGMLSRTAYVDAHADSLRASAVAASASTAIADVTGAEAAERGYLTTRHPKDLAEFRARSRATLRTFDSLGAEATGQPQLEAGVRSARRLTTVALRRLARRASGTDLTALQAQLGMLALEAAQLQTGPDATAAHDADLVLAAVAVLLILMIGAAIRSYARQAQLRRLAARLQGIADISPVGIALVEPRTPWRLLAANSAFERLSGLKPGWSPGKSLWAVLDGRQRPELRAEIGRLLDPSDDCAEIEFPAPAAAADGIWISATASPITDDDGRIEQIALHLTDTTARKERDRDLLQAAEHDPLTGLFNRRRFDEELRRVLAESTRYGSPASVLLCDLDGLKRINDTLGHEAGDAVIKAVSRAFRHVLRETDIIARWGGDEFAVLLSHTQLRDAQTTAERLRIAILELGPKMASPGVEPSLSIGVAPIVGGAAPRQCVAAADAALYQAKRGGRNQVVVSEQAAVADLA